MSSELTPIKRLTYRDSTKVLYKVIMGITIFSILLIVRYRIVHYLDAPIETTIWKLALACSVPVSILFRLYIWIRPRIYSVYEIYDESFVRVYRKKRELNQYEDIESVKISMFSPRFLGGFRVNMKNGQRTTFLSALKNSHKLLELIVQKRPELVDEKTLANYLKVSRIVDVSWKRMKEKLSDWKMLLAKFVAVPVILATLSPFILSNQESTNVLKWSEWIVIMLAVSFVLELVLNSIEETVALKTVEYDSAKEKHARHLDREKKIAQLFAGLFVVGMIGVFLGLKLIL